MNDNLKLRQQLITVNKMNIEKIVSNYFQRKRSQSTNSKRQHSQIQTAKKCYEPENHSFQPYVNQLPRSLYRGTAKTDCSREQIVQRLYTDRRSMENKRVQQKMSEQEREYQENCTFQPEVNQKSKRILKTECTEDDPFQRLYTDAITKKKIQQSLIYERQIQAQNYSFQPQTNYRHILNSQTCNLKPIHERIDQIVKQKREKLKILQQGQVSKEVKQKPEINQISAKIVSNRDQFKKGVLQRISGYIEQKKKKSEEEAAERQKSMLKQCTFKPEINSTIEVSTNFSTRQEQYLNKMQQKMNSRIVQNTFHPQINRISQILTREQRECQTMEDKLNRLTSDAPRRNKIEQIQQQLYQQCTFVPQINIISKCLAAEHVSHKCNHTPKQQEYQFKPRINKLSEQINKLVKLRKAESMGTFKENKTQILNQIKMENQYVQLKQCTFRPKINHSKPKNLSNKSLFNVRGYDSFIKKISKINQLKQEENQLQQKLFQKQKSYKSRKSTTPVTFKLSQGYNTKQAIKQEVKQKFQKQCTFKPTLISFR